MYSTKKIVLSSLVTVIVLLTAIPIPITQALNTIIRVPYNYGTIQEAIDSANPGDTILVSRGNWYGAIITKSLRIIGEPGATIVDGPQHPSYLGKCGFYINVEGAGSTISSFTFKGGIIPETGKSLDFAIFARGVDSITVTKNLIIDCSQSISNSILSGVSGTNWKITYNIIRAVSISSLSAIFMPGSSGNTVAFNVIEAKNSGLIGGSGILITGKDPGETSNNVIIFNSIKLIGTNTIGIQIFRGNKGQNIVEDPLIAKSLCHDNIIAYNYLRGCGIPLKIDPAELYEVNKITYNLT